jgi:hypothetical protein
METFEAMKMLVQWSMACSELHSQKYFALGGKVTDHLGNLDKGFLTIIP